MRRVVLLLPLLLGNMPAPCPDARPGDRVVDATVLSVERAQYRCIVEPDPHPPGTRCIAVGAGHLPCDVVLHVSDGTTREGNYGAGANWCDLPPGDHTVQLCGPDGAVGCAIHLNTGSVTANVDSSLPLRARVHLRLEDGTEVARDTDLDFQAGEHLRYLVRGPDPYIYSTKPGDATPPVPPLTRCDLATATAPAASGGHGCAHCNAGKLDTGSIVFIGVVLLVLGRRRR